MKQLLLVRHGESEWNRVGRIQGQTDTPLTEVGRFQAECMADFLSSRLQLSNLRMHVSPMRRARATASIIAREIGFPEDRIIVDRRLNDFHLGEIAGTHGWEQVAIVQPELARLRLHDPLNFHPPGGESGRDFWDRLADFLDQPADDNTTQLVVSHGVVNKFLRAIRRNLQGADIIAQGESQQSVFELIGDREIEHRIEERV